MADSTVSAAEAAAKASVKKNVATLTKMLGAKKKKKEAPSADSQSSSPAPAPVRPKKRSAPVTFQVPERAPSVRERLAQIDSKLGRAPKAPRAPRQKIGRFSMRLKALAKKSALGGKM